jgi:hypothetical protein
MVSMVSHGDGFGKTFGLIIDPTGYNGINISRVRFWLGMHGRVTINL